jgi:hypothetical protein
MARKPSATVDTKIRMKEALRRRLETESRKHAVSLNAEMVRRLERSFEADERIEGAFGDPREYGLALLLSSAVRLAGEEAMKQSGRPGHWLSDPYGYATAIRAAVRVFYATSPAGPLVQLAPLSNRPFPRSIEETLTFSLVGPSMANSVLDKVRTASPDDRHPAARIRELLGPELLDRIVQDLGPAPVPEAKQSQRQEEE